jgi:hypothetical protein
MFDGRPIFGDTDPNVNQAEEQQRRAGQIKEKFGTWRHAANTRH